MNPDRFLELQNLHIVYPGAAGGNHIQNMISLCSEFDNLFESVNPYEDELLLAYKKVNDLEFNKDMAPNHPARLHSRKAHFSKYHEGFSGLFNNPSNKKMVIAGHCHDYFEAIDKNTIPNIHNNMWIIVLFPKENSIPYRRACKGGWWPQNQSEYNWPYFCNRLYLADDNNGFTLQPELLFTATGSQYLRELLLQNFGIVLPELADKLHEIWYSWMKDI